MNDIKFIEALKQKRNACDYSQSRLAQELQIRQWTRSCRSVAGRSLRKQKQYKYLISRYVANKSAREIAEAEGVSHQAIEKHLNAAIKKVKKYLRDFSENRLSFG